MSACEGDEKCHEMKKVPAFINYNKGAVSDIYTIFDPNKNYRVTKKEVQYVFRLFDQNKDNFITQ